MEELAREADEVGDKGGGFADFLFGSLDNIDTLEQVVTIPGLLIG